MACLSHWWKNTKASFPCSHSSGNPSAWTYYTMFTTWTTNMIRCSTSCLTLTRMSLSLALEIQLSDEPSTSNENTKRLRSVFTMFRRTRPLTCRTLCPSDHCRQSSLQTHTPTRLPETRPLLSWKRILVRYVLPQSYSSWVLAWTVGLVRPWPTPGVGPDRQGVNTGALAIELVLEEVRDSV